MSLKNANTYKLTDFGTRTRPHTHTRTHADAQVEYDASENTDVRTRVLSCFRGCFHREEAHELCQWKLTEADTKIEMLLACDDYSQVPCVLSRHLFLLFLFSMTNVDGDVFGEPTHTHTYTHTHKHTRFSLNTYPKTMVYEDSSSVCGSVWQCVAVCCRVLQCVAVCCIVLQCVTVCCSALQCVAECCRVLQSVAVCRSVSQRVAAFLVSRTQ